ncbi:MAG: hypothetical protein COB77_04015 [Gammaproteobacteria bacterium]|nr:MAG: hypothetical protein COB77_04015 [Gammaproteobacteria bacterium]
MLGQTTLLFQQKTSTGLIEVFQKDNQRWLTIDAIEQSRIDIEQGEKLVTALHEAFLAVLLFTETPKKVLLAGLGGGALARYLHSIHPEITGVAVEKDGLIADLATRYFSFPEKNWSIITDDIRHWHDETYDFIVADIAEDVLTPAWLTSNKMLLQFKQQLSSDGVLVINFLVTDAQSFSRELTTIREIFKRRTLCLSVPEHKNVVVIAFNNQPSYASKAQLNSRVMALTALWGFDFNVLLSQLLKDNPVGSGIL